MNNRIEQLDSIRGIAAFCVVLSHIALVSVKLPLRLSPLWLANGHSAVIIFFILSGFVLSLPVLKSEQVNYLPYLIKRFFRIYIPYLVAILISILLCAFFYQGGIKTLSWWFNLSWTVFPTRPLILEHLLLISNIHSNYYDNVIWSLVHELRISIIFPLVVLILSRVNWKINLPICLSLSLIYHFSYLIYPQVSNGYNTIYFITLHYLSIFILGMLLAQHRESLVSIYRRTPRSVKWLILLILFPLYEWPGHICMYLHMHIDIIIDYITAICGCFIIIMALSSKTVIKLLMNKPVQYLGKISYSLYLYHLPTLLTMIYLFYRKIPLTVIYILVVPAAIIVSSVAWVLIENPSQLLGKKISKMLMPDSHINKPITKESARG